MADFRFFKMAAARHLGFLNIPIQRPDLHHRAKFHADRLTGCQDMLDFLVFKMASARHFGLSKI